MAAAAWRVSAHPSAAAPVELDEPSALWLEGMISHNYQLMTSTEGLKVPSHDGWAVEKNTGLCSLNVFLKKCQVLFSLIDRLMDVQRFFFPPACLQTDGDATFQQHKPFISPIQKYKNGSFPHSFRCRSVTIKHPQVEVLCGWRCERSVC